MNLRLDNNMIIKDIVSAINFFSKNEFVNLDLESIVRKKVKNIDFTDERIAHFGTNAIAKQLIIDIKKS